MQTVIANVVENLSRAARAEARLTRAEARLHFECGKLVEAKFCQNKARIQKYTLRVERARKWCAYCIMNLRRANGLPIGRILVVNISVRYVNNQKATVEEVSDEE